MLVTQGMDDVQVRGAATDIFSYLVEYNPSMVREFVMQESQQNDDVSISQRGRRWRPTRGRPQRFHNRVSFRGSAGHPPDQPDHRAHDLRHGPGARRRGAAHGPAADFGGPGEHAGHGECESVVWNPLLSVQKTEPS